MAPRYIWIFLLIGHTVCQSDFFNSISTGMKFAQNLLGSESVAQKVAEFVVKAFQTTNQRPTIKRPPIKEAYVEEPAYNNDRYSEETRPNYNDNEPISSSSPLRQLVRLFGLQPSQISAVAINALVFVAQMIATFLAGPKRQGSYRSEDTTTWILNKNSRRLKELLETAKNETFPELIEEVIKDHGNEEETSCIRLLVCKVTPFVSKMQSAVFKKEEALKNDSKIELGSASLYRHLPTENEMNERNDICERRHRDCNLNE